MHELKKQLRVQIARRKALYTHTELTKLSDALLNKLEQYPAFQQAKTVLLYYSLKDEVQTHDFVEKWSKTKNIVLPVVVGDYLKLRNYTGKQDLQTGSYNIEEPIGEIFNDYKSIDLAIIPGVSFDKEGNRLGRGKGYYDRLLPLLTSSFKIGICFSFQFEDKIPCEEHDIKMDCVFTDKEVFNGK